MKKIYIAWALLLIHLCIHPVLAESPLKTVSFLPQWIPQAQFAGYMVALEKGFYRDRGLNLQLICGGPSKSPFECLSAGEATFCTNWLSDGIEGRAWGKKIVNLAQIIQRSGLLLVAKKSSGIIQPNDLNGKKVALWEGHFSIPPRVFFSQFNLRVKVIPNYTSIAILLKDGVDACSVMWYNEYHTILNSGLNPDELSVFFLSSFGLNFPEDGIYCLEKTWSADPDLCEQFVQASLQGWLYAFDHQDEALDIVLRHAEAAHTGTNRAHQRWMLARMKDLSIPEGDKGTLGKLQRKDFVAVGNILKEFSLIRDLPDFDDFYRGHK